MLVGGVVDDEVEDQADAAFLEDVGELGEVAERAEPGVDRVVVGDVVAVVAVRAREEGLQPDAVDAQVLEMVDPVDEALEVSDAVAV